MDHPILSIVTVNFNNNKGLINTLRSVKQQLFSSYEHIIIDAGSSDESKETIIQYASNASYPVYWVSEPDRGIYDGMNKGISQAHGEYLYFLNSGDLLMNNVLQEIPFDGTKYLYGNIKLINNTGSINIIPPNELDILFFLTSTLPHQGCFIHHSLFNTRIYDINYTIVSDWIHMMHCIVIEDCSYKHFPVFIAEYDGSGISTTQPQRVLKERSKWIKSNIPVAYRNAFTELSVFRNSEFASIIPLLSKTRKFQKRVKRLVIDRKSVV